MGPLEPSDEGIFSKLLFFGALALLLVILAGCVYFIYGFVNPPQDGSSFPTPTPTPLPTPTVVVTPTPTFTPTPRLTPTLQIEPTPEPTATPVVQYIFDTRVTEGVKVLTPSGIWGNYIVYDRMIRNNNYEVHLYNLRSLSDIVIASGNVRSFGAIGSGKVALLNGDDKSIKLYDIEHKDTLQATPAKSIPREFPHIFDDLLIYSGNEGGTNEIVGKIDIFSLYTYRMSDGLYSMWAVNVPQPREPRGYGNYLVWWTLVDGKKEVILYDIKKVSSQKIADGGDHPRIYDNIVVYHGADHHIYLYDISTGKTRQLLTFGRQYTADIYGSKIVYDDNRDGNWDIYLFDLATGKETQVTNEPHDQMSPQIYGEDIIYMDNRNSQDGSWEVYTIRV